MDGQLTLADSIYRRKANESLKVHSVNIYSDNKLIQMFAYYFIQ